MTLWLVTVGKQECDHNPISDMTEPEIRAAANTANRR